MSTSISVQSVETSSPVRPEGPLPRSPVFGWASFEIVNAPGIACIEDLPFILFTTSGRAAIHHALLQLQLPTGSTVLVPTYHCPTMVAPVILANLQVAYFGITSDGLPNLDSIDPRTADRCGAMIVSHYFGMANSLAQVRKWCDDNGVALIEDCAHCYFGQAGERPIGSWGDFSTASLSKFLPVPEGGILASASRHILSPALQKPALKAELKGWVDVVELATKYKRLPGLNFLLTVGFRLKNARPGKHRGNGQVGTEAASKLLTASPVEGTTAARMMQTCDMARISEAPLAAFTWLRRLLPRGRIIAKRQRNYAAYSRHFKSVGGARPLFPNFGDSASQIAPYVFPLWVDDADFVYRTLRAQDLPVFRWDRLWPGTPQLEHDVGLNWSCHVLQLLCHQDLDETAINRTAHAVLSSLAINR